MKSRLPWVGAALVAIGLCYVLFLQQFPNEADCTASGRVVDPTRRQCEAGGGYVQLREHVILHSWEALFYGGMVGAVGLIAWRLRRYSRMKHDAR
jgi:hypothetical protein